MILIDIMFDYQFLFFGFGRKTKNKNWINEYVKYMKYMKRMNGSNFYSLDLEEKQKIKIDE